MRCLITGGAGFIGSHLSDVMLARGHDVHILDDLSTGAVENFAHLKSHPKFEYTIDSATNRSLVAELVDISDVVFRSEERRVGKECRARWVADAGRKGVVC